MVDLRKRETHPPPPMIEPNPIEVFENEGGRTYALDTMNRQKLSSERRLRDRSRIPA